MNDMKPDKPLQFPGCHWIVSKHMHQISDLTVDRFLNIAGSLGRSLIMRLYVKAARSQFRTAITIVQERQEITVNAMRHWQLAQGYALAIHDLKDHEHALAMLDPYMEVLLDSPETPDTSEVEDVPRPVPGMAPDQQAQANPVS